jgi:hypothetical protein
MGLSQNYSIYRLALPIRDGDARCAFLCRPCGRFHHRNLASEDFFSMVYKEKNYTTICLMSVIEEG